MAAAPLFSIVTTCKGRLGHIQQTLPVLAAMPMSEVVLVDYDCPDGVGEWARNVHPEVTVVRVAPRPRFNISEARNRGAMAATAPWLIFLDADVLVAPDLTLQLEPLLEKGVFLHPKSRPNALWGTLVLSRAWFEAIGGYDEAIEGWGAEDDEIMARLDIAGCKRRSFPVELLTAIPHSHAERTRFHDVADPHVNVRINTFYQIIKLDLLRLGTTLELPARKKLYADVKAALLTPGEPRSIKVMFRRMRFDDQSDQTTSLTYDLIASKSP